LIAKVFIAGMLPLIQANFNYRNLPKDSLCIPTSEQDSIEKRYFALINGDDEIEMIFFPRKDHQELTRLYFTEISKRLGIKNVHKIKYE